MSFSNSLDQWIKGLKNATEYDVINARIDDLSLELNSAGFDRWGLHKESLRSIAPVIHVLYRHYFRVKVSGIQNFPEGRVVVVGNHGGQLPIDALMVGLASFMEASPPRICRAMIERWIPDIPFISTLFNRMGAVVGDPKVCRDLLQHDQPVLVFPEGARGTGKLYKDRYQLQKFGTGFLRLALESQAPILPVAIVGAEEVYPGVGNIKSLAKILGAPYFPVTPLFPWLGPLGLVPLPSQIHVRFAEPIRIDADPLAPEEELQKHVQHLKAIIREQIQVGLRERGEGIFP